MSSLVLHCWFWGSPTEGNSTWDQSVDFWPVVRQRPHRGGRSSPVSDQVTAVTLLTLMDRRLSLSCFQAPWPFFHSIFSHLPSVFKRDGLIFPEIQFLSVRLMLFLRPSAAFVHFPLALVLSPLSQMCLHSKRHFAKPHTGLAVWFKIQLDEIHK